MSVNNQQLNTADDFFEFDFDENDVLVKDGEQENTKTRKYENKKTPIRQAQGRLQHEYNTNQKFEIEAPLELKKLKIASEDSAEKMRENLIREANMQKDKMEALKREGEGLVYDEKDEEEIDRFKKSSLTKSDANIDLLVRTLMSRLNIVSTLKIDLIKRLKNIIDSFLRDVRTSHATEELLQRSVESGGLNLSYEHTKQIIDFIKDEHKKIHSKVSVEEDNNVKANKKDDLFKISKSAEFSKEEVEAISKKTAREAQVGIFSQEMANSFPKKKFNESAKIDLLQWEKSLAIPVNLQTPEISAPRSVKELIYRTTSAKVSMSEPSKIKTQKGPTQSNMSFKGFKREEVLKSLNEELAQDENKVQNLEKKKTSWFSRMFGRKPAKSSKFKVQSSKFQVPSLEKKEMPRPQLIIRRVVQNKQNFDNRPKMEDVKVVHPHLVGPIEELSEMTLIDFRRLGSAAQDSVDKIREKIEMSAKEFFNQKIVAINGWRKSQPNQLYLELVRQSLSQRLSIEDLINQYNLENKSTLTKEEFDLISKLNKELRY